MEQHHQQNQQQQQIPPLPQHSDNVDEELRRVQLALQAVFAPTPLPVVQQSQQQYALSAGAAAADVGTTEQQLLNQRQYADRYLTSFQNQSIAWMVCDRLLQQDCSSIQQQQQVTTTTVVEQTIQQQRWFFAAQTLHKKCCNDIFELPETSLPSLRDSLLNHLQRYTAMISASVVVLQQNGNNNNNSNSTNDALVNRLAMCVAALAVQMGWVTIVTDLLGNNTSSESNPFSNITMSVLRALPEECASDRLLLRDDTTRYQMRDHLVSTSELVLSYLQAKVSTNTNDATIIETVLKVFYIWIRYVPIRAQVLVASPLLISSVQVLKDATTCSNNNNNNMNNNSRYLELAADVVVEVLHMYPSHHYGNDALVRVMIPELSNLPLDLALQSSYNDEDILLIYTRIVTEMGESYMSLILSNEYQLSSKLVDWVLKCSEIPIPEISAITFNFWYRMVTDLECCEPYEWRQELIDYYTPYLLKLIYICSNNLMKYPTDISMDDDDDDDEDDRMDDIKNHRFYVMETIEDCCRLLGGNIVLEEFGKYLREEVARVSQNNQQQLARTADWFGIESGLACITALHKFVSSDNTTVIPYCMSLIPHLPSQVPLLRYTANQIVGHYSFWLAAHPESMQPLLIYLSESLRIRTCNVVSAAATSIKELCERSNPMNFSLSEPVLQLYEEFASQPGNLQLPDELQILHGACSALTRTIFDTKSDGRTFLVRLAQPIGTRLAVAIQSSDLSSPNHTIIPEIDRLTTITMYLKLPNTSTAGGNNGTLHPIVELIQSLWNLFETVTQRFPRDTMLAEKICRFHKYSLRACGPVAYSPMLNSLLQQLVTSFNVTHQSPYLYAASICITEYKQDPTVASRFYEMIQAMATTAFSFLRTFDEITNHPDVIEEFFYLLGRMFDHHPDILTASPLLSSLFECSIVAMQLDHQGAQKGTLKFIESTINYGNRLRDRNNTTTTSNQQQPECQVALQTAYIQHGSAIVVQLVRILVGDLPSYSNQASDLIYKLSQLLPSQLSEWLVAAFQGHGQGGQSFTLPIPERAKGEFIAAIDMRLARDEFDLVINAFKQACDRERRIRRMTSIQQSQ